MGFLAKLAAKSYYEQLLQEVTRAWTSAKCQDPTLEPYEFMVNAWRKVYDKPGEILEAVTAKTQVAIFACLPVSLCLEAMVWQIVLSKYEEFSETKLFKEIGQRTYEVYRLHELCDADRLNELFKIYNPRSYSKLLIDVEGLPFNRERMLDFRRNFLEEL